MGGKQAKGYRLEMKSKEVAGFITTVCLWFFFVIKASSKNSLRKNDESVELRKETEQRSLKVVRKKSIAKQNLNLDQNPFSH